MRDKHGLTEGEKNKIEGIIAEGEEIAESHMKTRLVKLDDKTAIMFGQGGGSQPLATVIYAEGLVSCLDDTIQVAKGLNKDVDDLKELFRRAEHFRGFLIERLKELHGVNIIPVEEALKLIRPDGKSDPVKEEESINKKIHALIQETKIDKPLKGEVKVKRTIREVTLKHALVQMEDGSVQVEYRGVPDNEDDSAIESIAALNLCANLIEGAAAKKAISLKAKGELTNVDVDKAVLVLAGLRDGIGDYFANKYSKEGDNEKE